MNRTIKNYSSGAIRSGERGAVMAEYAIALAILLPTFAIGSALLLTAIKSRYQQSASVSADTVACSDSIRAIARENGALDIDVCR